MKIILDENMPRGLLRALAPHQTVSAPQAGFAGMKNGRPLAAIEGVYEAFLTADKNLRYQQNLTGRQFAIVECPPTAGRTCFGLFHRSSKRLTNVGRVVTP